MAKHTRVPGGVAAARHNRLSERRITQQIRRIIRTAGDNCSCCGAAFQTDCLTAAGVTHDGAVALVGDCCEKRLAHIVAFGCYGAPGRDPSPSAQFWAAMRANPAARDDYLGEVARRAGLSRPAAMAPPSQPWQKDDAAWFRKHPSRTHRARPELPGEAASLHRTPGKVMIPPGHEPWVLIRQVEPGVRVRKSWGHNAAAAGGPMPDRDNYIRALFDLISDGTRERGKVVQAHEVREREQRYLNEGVA